MWAPMSGNAEPQAKVLLVWGKVTGVVFRRHFMLFSYQSPVTSIVLDSAATLFTHETPNVLCGLKHDTHHSIGLVVSRYWVNFHFWVNYPFNVACTKMTSSHMASKILQHTGGSWRTLSCAHLQQYSSETVTNYRRQIERYTHIPVNQVS